MNKKNAFYSGLFFGTAMTVFFCFQNGIVSGLIAGPTAGVLFGACMYWFVNSKMISKQTAIDGEVEGDVLYSGPANHYLNGEAAGGKLYLLGDKLFF